MIRSLRTGVIGMRSHQMRMDVIGNNLANVNTAGFKRGRVAFQDLIGQRMQGGGSVGNGARVAGVDQSWTQGAFDFTGMGSDLALAGDGFFVANGPNGNVLTRAGNFQFNAEGFLVTPGGYRVQGWGADGNGNVSTGQLRDLRIDLNASAPPRETSSVTLGGNLSADLIPNEDGSEATLSTVIYDGQGKSHTLVLTFSRTDQDQWTVSSAQLAGNPDATPPIPATDLDGTGLDITFDNDGNLVGPASLDLSGVFPNTNGDDLAITVDLSALTQFGGSTTARASEQNGSASGRLVGFGFDPEGRLLLAFSNGEERVAAQLALGTVTNPDGLEPVGDNLLAANLASGAVSFGRAGEEINTQVIAGALELSNVDVATEFTDMIVTQRGFQAAARVITTSDELLQETVNLKR